MRLEATNTARPIATPLETGKPKIWMLIFHMLAAPNRLRPCVTQLSCEIHGTVTP